MAKSGAERIRVMRERRMAEGRCIECGGEMQPAEVGQVTKRRKLRCLKCCMKRRKGNGK